MMFLLAALCLGLAVDASPRATSLTQCSNHADGFCIDSTQFECPAGWMWSYSGCGFLEKCCYPQAGSHQGVTSAPNAPTTHAPAVSANSCGISTIQPGLKIVGGETTTIQAHPWQISLRENGHHICGGTIVASNWVMTAAHCVEDATSTRQITILAGSTSLRSYSSSQVHSVSRILMHSQYGGHEDGYDIAMIKLNTHLDLTSSTTRAICLPGPTETFDGETCVASGWGYLREGGSVVSTLHHVALPIISNNLCDYYMYGVHDKIICAGRTSGGIDTCQGDSGGPLVCQARDGSWKQAGIVSNGVGCARRNKFGFYTAVGQFDSWIQSVMSRY